MRRLLLIPAVLFALAAPAQTTINGSRTILGNWDASGANTTKACKAGTSPPGTCAVGECFYDTDAAAETAPKWCSATNTWTNTTLDEDYVMGCTCNASTAARIWSLPSASAPTPACAGTNSWRCTLSYADAATNNSYLWKRLPSTWVGQIDVVIQWYTTATTGSVVWQVATTCVAATEANDPTYNTPSTVTDAANGSASTLNEATITNLDVTGCAAGEMLNLKIFRDATHASDDLAAAALILGAEIRLRRAV